MKISNQISARLLQIDNQIRELRVLEEIYIGLGDYTRLEAKKDIISILVEEQLFLRDILTQIQ